MFLNGDRRKRRTAKRQTQVDIEFIWYADFNAVLWVLSCLSLHFIKLKMSPVSGLIMMMVISILRFRAKDVLVVVVVVVYVKGWDYKMETICHTDNWEAHSKGGGNMWFSL